MALQNRKVYRFDNALAESFDGLCNSELIHRQGLWRNVEHVEM
jgi:hypothetical protein